MNPSSLIPPRSPFATRLSGSAKETELRIRSIFQWKKKRPPVLIMALMGVLILLCGSLVSWSAAEQPPGADSGARFTDTFSVSVGEARVLSLSLQGQNSQALGPYYDQVQVLEGDQVLQTILPEFPLPASNVFDADTLARTTIPPEHYPPVGFSAGPSHTVYIQDVNFDGAEDLGLPCDSTRAGMHAWYLWNPAAGQFEYAFALAGELTADEEAQQLIEHPSDPDAPGHGPAAYSFNAYGQLVWAGAPES